MQPRGEQYFLHERHGERSVVEECGTVEARGAFEDRKRSDPGAVNHGNAEHGVEPEGGSAIEYLPHVPRCKLGLAPGRAFTTPIREVRLLVRSSSLDPASLGPAVALPRRRLVSPSLAICCCPLPTLA
jgi:hypothetical protein